MFARNAANAEAISRQFRERTVRTLKMALSNHMISVSSLQTAKWYLATLHGHLSSSQSDARAGVIWHQTTPAVFDVCVPLSGDPLHPPRQQVDWSDNGKWSRTLGCVLDTGFTSDGRQPITTVLLHPITGRYGIVFLIPPLVLSVCLGRISCGFTCFTWDIPWSTTYCTHQTRLRRRRCTYTPIN